MNAQDFVGMLEGVRSTPPRKGFAACWMAKCPGHEDKSSSLSIAETVEGHILINCFAQCDKQDIVNSVGLTMADLMPEKVSHHKSGTKRAFDAYGALKAISLEVLVLKLLAKDMSNGKQLTDDQRKRCGKAYDVLNSALNAIDGAR